MAGLEEFANAEEIRAALNKTLRLLDAEKKRKGHLVDAVYQAAHDAAVALDYKPVPKPALDRRTKGEEVAIAISSDWQLGKVTPDYNTDVCEERVERYADKLEKLVAIQRADHPVKEARLYLLGDHGEGELIFPGQAHRIDASLFRQVMVDGPRILGNLLRRMAGIFERVHTVGVIGNHGALGGRGRRDMHPETNADAMLYEVTRLMLAGEDRITWAPNMTPGERHWYAIDQVGSKRFMLFHGDQVKGYNGIPWYGFDRKVKGWFMVLTRLIAEEGFDYALSGHFHTPFREYINGITHWGNGSTESYNTYAAEQLASAGEPQQWLLFCHPEHGVTAEYSVRLA